MLPGWHERTNINLIDQFEDTIDVLIDIISRHTLLFLSLLSFLYFHLTLYRSHCDNWRSICPALNLSLTASNQHRNGHLFFQEWPFVFFVHFNNRKISERGSQRQLEGGTMRTILFFVHFILISNFCCNVYFINLQSFLVPVCVYLTDIE